METVNQDTQVTQEANETERTFTQAELDNIVKERLRRDRADRADYDELKAKAARLDEIEEANKTELQKATDRADSLQKELDALKNAEKVRVMRQTVAQDTGVPAKLLTADTEEGCKEQAAEILRFAKPTGYPSVKDGGEVGGQPKGATRDKFAEWFNSI